MNDLTPASRVSMNQRVRHHLESFAYFFSWLKSHFISTSLPILLLALSLILPILLLSSLDSVSKAIYGSQAEAKVMAFIDPQASPDEQSRLIKRLQTFEGVKDISVISKKQALLEFQEFMGLTKLSQTLTDNPLPAVIEIQPEEISTKSMENLAAKVLNFDIVDEVKTDSRWVLQLSRFFWFYQLIVYIALFILLMIMFNLIMREVQRVVLEHKLEVEIKKLIGASHSYAVRPFYYMGFWYGLLSALIGFLFAVITVKVLNPYMLELAQSLEMNWQLDQPSAMSLFIVTIFCIITGIFSAWLGTRSISGPEPY